MCSRLPGRKEGGLTPTLQNRRPSHPHEPDCRPLERVFVGQSESQREAERQGEGLRGCPPGTPGVTALCPLGLTGSQSMSMLNSGQLEAQKKRTAGLSLDHLAEVCESVKLGKGSTTLCTKPGPAWGLQAELPEKARCSRAPLWGRELSSLSRVF